MHRVRPRERSRSLSFPRASRSPRRANGSISRCRRSPIIEWEGQRVEALASQYNAYPGSRIEEVAYDYYAQADDGSVWYFGEDVFDFRDGAIVVTEA
jgi:hypothetical protein